MQEWRERELERRNRIKGKNGERRGERGKEKQIIEKLW